jgi:hypothetical protein
MARAPYIGLVLASSVALAGCNAVKEALPTEPSATPTPKATQPVLSIPVVLPKATPTPAPAATPVPAATPAPAPTPPPSGPSFSSCSLPESNPSNPSCAKTSPKLVGKLEKAITAATQAHPEYFDTSDKRCDNCYRVLNESGYIAEVQRQLLSQGVCSIADADEIDIKASNDLSEQYDILLSTGHIRRGEGAYLYGCNPADF